nr:ECF-type sigma factor [uncultured Roseateles sp.]
MKDITELLQDAGQGDRAAADQVVAQLYGDLQRLARQRIRQAGDLTLLDTTALVHEAWLRLAGSQGQTFPDRRHSWPTRRGRCATWSSTWCARARPSAAAAPSPT